MQYKLTNISINDGKDIYDMLQETPADENGFINSVYGKSYEEYKEWLIRHEKTIRDISTKMRIYSQFTLWV